MNIKPVPVPPEQTAFKKGVPMSQQLRQEREIVEKSAIKHKATPDELGAPIRRGPKPGSGGRPRKELGANYTPKAVTDGFSELIKATLELPTEQHIKVKLISAVISMHQRGEL
jgi:hypothetical protein